MIQLKNFVDRCHDKLFDAINNWLQRSHDRKVGITPEQRVWLNWYDLNVNRRAGTVQQVYAKFDHIIEVDHKTFLCQDFSPWHPVQEFDGLRFPARQLDECAVWDWFRGEWEQHDSFCRVFRINDFTGGDHVFVATNNQRDAVWIALKWGK